MEKAEFQISTDKALLQFDRILALLQATYWGGGMTMETVKTAAENSICFGVYRDGRQVGYARCVTDYATMYYLCDVVVGQECRGHGMGKALMRAVTEHEQLRALQGILSTGDAHGLYSQYGFAVVEKDFMRK